MVLMLLRQADLAKGGPCFAFLSSDSSPQGGLEYYIVLEDRVSRKAAAALVEATEAERSQWLKSGFLATSTLPVAILGSGSSSGAAKFEALAHAVVLDAMFEGQPTAISEYATSVVSFCSDFGAEASVAQLPNICVQELLKNNVENSGGLLALRNVISNNRFQPLDEGSGEIIEECSVVEDIVVQDHDTPTGPCYFGLLSSLMIPGVKHMFDNVQKELINCLHHYPTFSVAKNKS